MDPTFQLEVHLLFDFTHTLDECVCALVASCFTQRPLFSTQILSPSMALILLMALMALTKTLMILLTLVAFILFITLMTLRTFIMPMIDDKLDCWFFF